MFETKILKPSKQNIKLVAAEIRKGNLVGMPTETVYGLAANAFDDAAIKNIFTVKNRPQDNPLIVHIYKNYDLNQIVKNISPIAKKLIKKFTPGPLTLVFKSNKNLSNKISCGLDTVAIRIPSHKITQKFLKECNIPIAAPSANISTHMSPTTALDVKEELNGKLEYILDGGRCKVGIESTVIDVTGNVPKILRPGKITKEMIEKVLFKKTTNYKNLNDEVYKQNISPGVKYKHYSPIHPLIVGKLNEEITFIKQYNQLIERGFNPVILCMDKYKKKFKGLNLIIFGKTLNDVAKNLYSSLRNAEKKYNYLLIYPVNEKGLGYSIMNRINKMTIS